jgi:hypothetical protein
MGSRCVSCEVKIRRPGIDAGPFFSIFFNYSELAITSMPTIFSLEVICLPLFGEILDGWRG